MRLIDADRLKEEFYKRFHEDSISNITMVSLGEVIKFCDEQTTAYSTEEVVEQLKEHFDATENKDMRLAYHHAINIVKGGGEK